MNPDVKRRIVMSLVSLALAFGLLATYYIVTVPWNRTAVGQALTAGALVGIGALVVQFIPIRSPIPAVATPSPAPAPVPVRAWRPEPEFAAEDFAADVAGEAATVKETPSLPIGLPMPAVAQAAPIGLPPASRVVETPDPVPVEKPIEILVQTAPPSPPPQPARDHEPPPQPTEPAPLPVPALASDEPLAKAIETVDTRADDSLTVAEMKESLEVLRVRNDYIRIPEKPPVEEAQAAVDPLPILAGNVRPASAPIPAQARKRPVSGPRAAEWRDPDPEAPKELLRELAEYWHVKFETEKHHSSEILSKYEEVLRRLEQLEERTARAPLPPAPKKPAMAEGSVARDDLSVEDSARNESADQREDRWDQRSTQIEHFH